MSSDFYRNLSRMAGVFALFGLVCLVLFMTNIEIKDYDLWLHLAMGKFIAQNQYVPAVDVLSCTIAGQPWVNHEWLFQLLVHFIYQLTGFDGLINFQMLVVGLTFLLLLFFGYRKDNQFIPVLALLLVLQVYQWRFTIRPDIISLLFFILYIRILSLHLGSKGVFAAVFILQVLWTNMHGYFILGPLLIFMAIVSEFLKRKVRLPFEWNTVGKLSDAELKNLNILLFVSLLASCVNPLGIKGILYPFNVLLSLPGESKIFFEYITELAKPITWNNIFSLQPYPYYRILIVLSFLSFLANIRKVDIFTLLFWLSFLIFSLNALRNVVFFSCVAYLVIIANLTESELKSILPEKIKENFKTQCILAFFLKTGLVLYMFVVFDGLIVRGYFDFETMERKKEFGRGVSLRNFPTKAADFLVENNIKGNFFNGFNVGSYLLGRAYPNIRVFIDGRTEVYGAEFYKEFQKLWVGDKDLLDKAIDKYNLTGVFLDYNLYPAPKNLSRYLYESSEWKLVYFGYDASIFLRDIPSNKEWIEKFALDLKGWQSEPIDLLKLGTQNVTPYMHVNRAYALVNYGLMEEAMQEAQKALAIMPFFAEPYIILSRIYLSREDYFSAYESLRKAKILAPAEEEVRYNLAYVFYKFSYLGQAKENLNRISENSYGSSRVFYLRALIAVSEKRFDEAYISAKQCVLKGNCENRQLTEISEALKEVNEIELAEKVLSFMSPKEKK